MLHKIIAAASAVWSKASRPAAGSIPVAPIEVGADDVLSAYQLKLIGHGEARSMLFPGLAAGVVSAAVPPHEFEQLKEAFAEHIRGDHGFGPDGKFYAGLYQPRENGTGWTPEEDLDPAAGSSAA